MKSGVDPANQTEESEVCELSGNESVFSSRIKSLLKGSCIAFTSKGGS